MIQRWMKTIEKQKSPRKLGLFMAESEGFEPPVGCPTSVFKTGALNQLCQLSAAKVLIL
jgi:hypothetical protein